VSSVSKMPAVPASPWSVFRKSVVLLSNTLPLAIAFMSIDGTRREQMLKAPQRSLGLARSNLRLQHNAIAVGRMASR
jgi:hypothetical protein